MAAPKGNQNAAKGRRWSDAVRKQLMRDAGDDRKKIDAVAEKLVDLALEGDMQAIKEVGDRIDGKASLSIEHDGNITVTWDEG